MLDSATSRGELDGLQHCRRNPNPLRRSPFFSVAPIIDKPSPGNQFTAK
jgi:hypothetical protein